MIMMKYFQMIQVISLICLINVCVSIDSEGNSQQQATREIEQPLQQHEQDSEQQEVHQVSSSEYPAYKNTPNCKFMMILFLYFIK